MHEQEDANSAFELAEGVTDTVGEITARAAAGDLSEANVRLCVLPRPSVIRERLDGVRRNQPPRELARRGSVSPARQLVIYNRDGFTCRYCGKRSIAMPVLRAL